MSVDLQELFDQEGVRAPASTIDPTLVVRRGRRLRLRRRAAAGAGAAVGVGVLTVGAVTVIGSVPHPGKGVAADPIRAASAATSSTPAVSVGQQARAHVTHPKVIDMERWGPAPKDLAAIGLADPAPGFPVLQWADLAQEDGTGWVTVFAVAKTPDRVETFPSGAQAGQPTGPEARIFVSHRTTPHLEGPAVHTLPESPSVAGVTGHVQEYTEKGETFHALWFTKGSFMVEISGGDGVDVDQLVALGDALTGLD